MPDIWSGLSATTQDLLILIALLCPGLILAVVLLRGYAPWSLLRALLGRQRWAAVTFTVLIAISVGLGVGLIAQERGLRDASARTTGKFDLIVSAPGSALSVMLGAVFLQPTEMPLLGGDAFNRIASQDRVGFAAPLAFGDSVDGAPVIGTTREFVTHLADGPITGQMFTSANQAVVGALSALEVGDHFKPQHGMIRHIEQGGADDFDHAEHDFEVEVTGRLPLTGTPWDHAILMPVEAVWQAHGLADGHAPENAGQLGGPFDADYFPGTPVVLVKPETLGASYALREAFTTSETMAFFPGAVLLRLHGLLGDVRQVMSLLALVTQVLVATAVMVGLVILTRLFARQVAVLRAIGAPARFVFALLWSFGLILILAGCVLGLGLGYGATVALSHVLSQQTDLAISAQLGWPELHMIAGFFGLTSLIAAIPALSALRQPVLDSVR